MQRGGKDFKYYQRKKEIIVNDKNNKSLNVLKENIRRLKFNPKLYNRDMFNYDTNVKYDFIILDIPCSAVGAIRKNPEIFLKEMALK